MNRSETLFERAERVLPRRGQQPRPRLRAVGGSPRFIASADGAVLRDADGRAYIDYVAPGGR
jgi:glutamate-1-semialdehyde 2,1-aminomutase